MSGGAARSAALVGLSASAATVAGLAPLPIIVGAVGLATGVALLLLPTAALASAAFAVPFGNLAALPLGGGALTPAPILLALAAVGLSRAGLEIARGRSDGRAGPATRQAAPARFVYAAAAAYLLVLGLSTWFARDFVAAVIESARWVELVLAMLLVQAACDRHPRARAILTAALLLAGAAAAAWGIWQALGRIGPPAFAILGGRLYRAFGTFGQPNPFGGFMNLVWPIGGGLLLATLTSIDRAKPFKGNLPTATLTLVGVACACVSGLGLVLSWSRGAWLGAAAGGTAMLVAAALVTFRRPWNRPRVTAVATILLAGTVALSVAPDQLLPSAVADRLASVATTFAVWDVADAEVNDANYATIERVAHWEAAARMWSAQPWLGQGPGHYELVYSAYRLPRWEPALGHAHNYYLHALAETGLLGLAVFLLLLASVAGLALRRLFRPRGGEPLDRALGLALLGVLAAVAVHSLVDNLFVHDMPIYLGLLVGLTAGRTS